MNKLILLAMLVFPFLVGCNSATESGSSSKSTAVKVTEQTGKIVINPQFDATRNFSNGLAAVRIDEQYIGPWGFIDRTGKVIIDAKIYPIPQNFSQGLAGVSFDSENYKWMYIDN